MSTYLVTTITYCVVRCIAAWLEVCLCKTIQVHIFNGWNEGMLRIVTMLESNMARDTKVEVLT